MTKNFLYKINLLSVKLLGGIILSTSLLPNLHASHSSVNRWSSAIVYAGKLKVSSGVPVSRCHILSNEHAVRHRQVVTVAIANQRYSAKVVAIDKQHDLSLMRIERCPIQNWAEISDTQPVKGDKLTSVYYRPGIISGKIIRSKGRFLGYQDIITEENREMVSMVIDDTLPGKGASGGGVTSENGLVSIIFGITDGGGVHKTFAVDYFSLTEFLHKNGIY